MREVRYMYIQCLICLYSCQSGNNSANNINYTRITNLILDGVALSQTGHKYYYVKFNYLFLIY